MEFEFSVGINNSSGKNGKIVFLIIDVEDEGLVHDELGLLRGKLVPEKLKSKNAINIFRLLVQETRLLELGLYEQN